jgi:hypothetical protein
VKAEQMKRRAGELVAAEAHARLKCLPPDALAILRAVAGGEVFHCSQESVMLGGMKIPHRAELERTVNAFDTTARKIGTGEVLVIGGEDG